MFSVLSSINWLSVVIAFLAYFLLGALWYLLLFPRAYRLSLGRDPNINASQSPLYIIGPGVCAFIVTLSCAVLLYALNLNTYAELIPFVLIVGGGFLFTNTVNIAINPNIPRPFFYGLITGMYQLTSIALVSMILLAMK